MPPHIFLTFDICCIEVHRQVVFKLRLSDRINGFNKAIGPSVAGIAPEIEAMQVEFCILSRVKDVANAKLGLGVF